MRRYAFRIAIWVVLLLWIAVLLVDCLGDGAQPGGPYAAETIDGLVAAVLMNMHQHAWNPRAMTRGKVTGGLYINWKMDDPTSTNMLRPGDDTRGSHDPQVDLLYLVALAEYQRLHPQLHTYDGDLRRATALVLSDFARYSVPKGWIYFYLLDGGLLLHNGELVAEARAVAANFYRDWYDPARGGIYDHEHSPPDYTPNHALQCGAALIDAGQRWRQPEWVSAGERTLQHIITVAFDQRYRLFYDSMLVDSSGRDQPEGNIVRPSTEGEAASALVTAYELTHQQRYLDVAGQVLQSLFTTSGLWDTQRGGFYFALRVDSGSVISAYKETRSQSLALIALQRYNQVQPRFVTQERRLIDLLTGPFYQHTYHGYVYRLTSDFRIYVSKPGAGIGVEDYFTTEAMGSALDALQRTELGTML